MDPRARSVLAKWLADSARRGFIIETLRKSWWDRPTTYARNSARCSYCCGRWAGWAPHSRACIQHSFILQNEAW